MEAASLCSAMDLSCPSGRVPLLDDPCCRACWYRQAQLFSTPGHGACWRGGTWILRPISRWLIVSLLDLLDKCAHSSFLPYLIVLYSCMGYVCKCFRCLYAYKHASSFYCHRGIAFSFFHPSMIISLHLSIVKVTLVVELVFEIAYHFMLSLTVIFSFLSVIFSGLLRRFCPSLLSL